MKHLRIVTVAAAAVWLFGAALALHAQGQGQGRGRDGQGGGVPAAAGGSGRGSAPFDITGYWVSVVSDDWRYRMLTPPKGNVDTLPVNAAGRGAAAAWDPAKDAAAGEACKGYGAIGAMRLPNRLNISWESDSVLKVDIDTGTQTRRFNFNPQATPPQGDAGYQGFSVASWQGGAGGRRGGGPPGGPGGAGNAGAGGELLVTTTHMKPGYLRKNGVPYSAGAVLTEWWIRLVVGDQQFLAVTQMLDDPMYFTAPYIKTIEFKKEADGKGWNPTACSAQ